MDRPRQNDANLPPLDGLPFMVVGAHAAASYAPERATQDIDIIVSPSDLKRLKERLESDGWEADTELTFPSSSLGLFGRAFSKPGEQDIDVLSSDAAWLNEAFEEPQVVNAFGRRVMPLAYLVLMKLDSARGVDQGDLTRMLGRIGPSEVEEIAAIVERHYGEGAVAEDVRQYAEIGRWEYEAGR